MPLENILEVRALGVAELPVGVRDIQEQDARGKVQRINKRFVARPLSCGLFRLLLPEEALDRLDEHGG